MTDSIILDPPEAPEEKPSAQQDQGAELSTATSTQAPPEANEHEFGAGSTLTPEQVAQALPPDDIDQAPVTTENPGLALIKVIFEHDVRRRVFASINGQGYSFPVGEVVEVAEHVAEIIGNYTRVE